MKTVRVLKSRGWREIEAPTSWEEAHDMLTHVLGPHFDKRGGNVERMSVVARVAYGLFANDVSPADPTIVLVHLMQKICKARGAGLAEARPE